MGRLADDLMTLAGLGLLAAGGYYAWQRGLLCDLGPEFCPQREAGAGEGAGTGGAPPSPSPSPPTSPSPPPITVPGPDGGGGDIQIVGQTCTQEQLNAAAERWVRGEMSDSEFQALLASCDAIEGAPMPTPGPTVGGDRGQLGIRVDGWNAREIAQSVPSGWKSGPGAWVRLSPLTVCDPGCRPLPFPGDMIGTVRRIAEDIAASGLTCLGLLVFDGVFKWGLVVNGPGDPAMKLAFNGVLDQIVKKHGLGQSLGGCGPGAVRNAWSCSRWLFDNWIPTYVTEVREFQPWNEQKIPGRWFGTEPGHRIGFIASLPRLREFTENVWFPKQVPLMKKFKLVTPGAPPGSLSCDPNLFECDGMDRAEAEEVVQRIKGYGIPYAGEVSDPNTIRYEIIILMERPNLVAWGWI